MVTTLIRSTWGYYYNNKNNDNNLRNNQRLNRQTIVHYNYSLYYKAEIVAYNYTYVYIITEV